MKRLLGSLGLGLAVAASACGQIERPGAFDDSFAKCRGLTCLWASSNPVHEHLGAYEFFLSPMPDDVTNIQTNLVVNRGGVEVARTPLKDLSASVAMTWSSDFRTFAVTWSDGGMIGEFHVKVLRLQGERFVELPTASRAFSHFKSRHDCPDRGDNIQAYRFEESGSRLMLILSVYPTSDCGKEMGYTEGYLVRAQDGAILRQYSLPELNIYMRQYPEGS